MDGMFGGGNDGKPPSHGFPSPFGGDPLGSMFGSMMGGMFSEMIDGMRQMDELSKAFEHSFGESLHRGAFSLQRECLLFQCSSRPSKLRGFPWNITCIRLALWCWFRMCCCNVECQ